MTCFSVAEANYSAGRISSDSFADVLLLLFIEKFSRKAPSFRLTSFVMTQDSEQQDI